MARHLAVGIDIGSQTVRTVIAEETREEGRAVPRVLGTGFAESRGLSRGFIVNAAEVSECVRLSVERAEAAAGLEVKRAFVSVGGVGLSSAVATGSVAISRADLEVTNLDIEKAQEEAEASLPEALSLNRKIINSVPLSILLDDKPVLGRVEGMRGGKLEMKMLFISCLEHHLEDLIRAVEGAGVEVIDVVASPIASSFVTLSKKQKRAGCLLMNVGAETTSIVVFENSSPLSLEVFEMGGSDLTNDIALGLKLPLEDAEAVKLGAMTRIEYPKKKLDDITGRRFGEIFDLVEGHLKRIGRQGLLPAGVVLVGGGAAVYGVKDFAESALKLPARVGDIHFGNEELRSTKDLAWTVAYGLAVFGFNAENEQSSVGSHGMERIAENSRRGLRALTHWVGKILP